MTPFSPDILARYKSEFDYRTLAEVREERRCLLAREHWRPLLEILPRLPTPSQLSERGAGSTVVVDQPCISIGRREDLTVQELELLEQAVGLLVPWRKGPFSLFGRYIDAEWRSDFKWARLEPHLPPLNGLRIADVGCGNGYYMLRASAGQPECVIGLDPSEQFYLTFSLLQHFAVRPNLQFEILSAEHLTLFPKFFDLTLCLGVIYHQRNPLQLLQQLHESLRPGGLLFLESQAIPGAESEALFPADRYAKARNVYFVPTAACIMSWMRRTGFVDVKLCSAVPLSCEEQRRTALAPYESLEDFLDPQDPAKTVEGYPAPWRVIVAGCKL